MALDDQRLLREHYEIMADIKSLKRAVEEGETDRENLLKRIEALEEKARKNDMEHREFVPNEAITGIRHSLQKLEQGTVIMTPQQAKKDGSTWWSILLKSPTHLMWLILAAVVITMIFMGYSYAEISQVLDRMR